MTNFVIPDWADKKAERVLTMFSRGDTVAIDRALLHGAFAAALCEERERCAEIADGYVAVRVAANPSYGAGMNAAAVEIASAIRSRSHAVGGSGQAFEPS